MQILLLLFTFFIVFPNVFLLAISFCVSFYIVKALPLDIDSLIGISIVIFFASIILFLITLIIHRFSKNKSMFKSLFEINYLINMYIWGLLTLLALMKPEMMEAQILTHAELSFLEGYTGVGAAMLFFVNLSNHAIFSSFFLD